ncbi:MAG TPA: hypothetical protein PK109_01595 [Candidatus Paceibacterota bacterium]|nr:hypothetical protein [Candidatus Paceibacterota bacterium]
MSPEVFAPKLEKERLVHDLLTQTYSSVPFPLSHEEIDQAVGKYFAFLTRSQEEKNAMLAKRPNDPVSDMGYVRVSGDASVIGSKDFKEYFHYHPEAEAVWAKEAGEDVRVREFFDAAALIWQKADETGREVVRTLDAEFPGLYDAFFPADRPQERILRFLKYDARGMGNFLARAHYDRGGCTLGIAESAPGLRIGKDEATLMPVVHKDRTALFFPAIHFNQLSGGRVPAAWHDVVQASDDAVSEDAARWAVVYFMNAPAMPFPSEFDTHVPIK